MDNNQVKGLGGWLILVGIGIVIGPFYLVYNFGPLFYNMFTDGSWEVLTTVGSEVYNPLWAPLLLGEFIYNLSMVLIYIYLIYLFFTKHYFFPKIYISALAIPLFFVPINAWVVSLIFIDEPIFDPVTMQEFIRIIIVALIWIPYMLFSRRVEATFVEKNT